MTTPSIADFRYKSTEHSAFSCSSRAVVTHFSTPTGIGRIVLPDTWPWTLNQSGSFMLQANKTWSNSFYLINCRLEAVRLWKTKIICRPSHVTEWLTQRITSCATLKWRTSSSRVFVVISIIFKVKNSSTYISGHPEWFSVLDKSGTKISSTRHDNWSIERIAKSPEIINDAQSSRGTSIGSRLTK